MRVARDVPNALEQDGVRRHDENRQAGPVEGAVDQGRSIRGQRQLQSDFEELGDRWSQRIGLGKYSRRSWQNEVQLE